MRTQSIAPLLVLWSCAALPSGEQPSRPPNILLVLIDDLGKEWVSCYGGPAHLTPNLERLAAEGTCFDNAYVMPQCTPTRVSLLTGQYPFRHGWVNHWDVPRWGHGAHFDPHQNPSLARSLRQAGYATMVAGKWQINDFRVQPEALFEHGFDRWAVWTGFETGVPASAERYGEPYVFTPEGSATVPGGFGPDVFTEALTAFIEEHAEVPFFAYYPMVLTHAPLVATPLEPGAEGKQGRQRAMVRYADHCIGRLLDALDRSGLRQETLVVVLSDNGSTRGVTGSLDGRPVKGGKGQTREAGVCVPWIVRWPGATRAGVRSTALTDVTDLFPTLLEVARARPPEGWYLDGHSLAALLEGRSSEGPRSWIMAMGGQPAVLDEDGRVVPRVRWRERVVREERWKLVVDRERRPAALFDLSLDSAAEQDLLGELSPGAEAALARLQDVVARFPASDGAPRYRRLSPQTWDWQGVDRR